MAYNATLANARRFDRGLTARQRRDSYLQLSQRVIQSSVHGAAGGLGLQLRQTTQRRLFTALSVRT